MISSAIDVMGSPLPGLVWTFVDDHSIGVLIKQIQWNSYCTELSSPKMEKTYCSAQSNNYFSIVFGAFFLHILLEKVKWILVKLTKWLYL